jgi:hypothetical protein
LRANFATFGFFGFPPFCGGHCGRQESRIHFRFFTKFSEFSACHNFLPLDARELQLERGVTWVTLKLRFKFDALPVKVDRVIDVSFPVLRHVGDVTVGGRSVC